MKHQHLGKRIAIVTSAALAIGVASIAGIHWHAKHAAAGDRRAHATTSTTAGPTLAPVFARLRSQPALADVAERVVASVVNISSEKIVRTTGGPPAFGPLLNDPFFRHFFGGPWGTARRPETQRENSLGSGVIVSDDGTVLTNNHVIENADAIRVSLSDGRAFDAEIVGRDPDSDLGVLKLKGELKDLKPMAFGDSSALRLGDVVLAVGNPFGVGQTVTMGIVSAKGRASVGIVQYEDFIQTDAAINPGNSGGALVNMRGELVGINTAILSRTGGYQGIGFAIPSAMAQPIMASLLEDGKVERGWLGVAIQDVTPELKEALGLGNVKGVLVADVTPGSPAERGGLKRGDVVLELNGKPMESSAQLRNSVALSGADAEVSLELLREGERKPLRLKLGERTSSGRIAKLDRADSVLGGLTVSEMTDGLRGHYDIPRQVEGVVVTEVQPGSTAARAGFRPGDVIVELNRRHISSPSEFADAYRDASGMVAVLVQRHGNTLYLAFRK